MDGRLESKRVCPGFNPCSVSSRRSPPRKCGLSEIFLRPPHVARRGETLKIEQRAGALITSRGTPQNAILVTSYNLRASVPRDGRGEEEKQ